MSFDNRIFLRWNEAAEMLSMDREGLRQALLYRWSPTRSSEKAEWLPVMLSLPGQEFMTTLDWNRWEREADISWHGRDSYYRNTEGKTAITFSDGSSLPLCAYSDGASWDSTHGYGTNWGTTFTVGGERLVVSPESVANACAADGHIGALSIAPTEWCKGGFPYHQCFLVVDCENSMYVQQPRDLFDCALFLRTDVLRMLSLEKLDETEKPLDERERTTLLCMIGALARHQGLDLSQPMKAGDIVASMAPDLKWSGRSIGEHLKRVSDAMDRRRS